MPTTRRSTRTPQKKRGEPKARPAAAAPTVAAEPPPGAPLRRVPVQARSRKRFEAILDAAAVEFASEGFEASTMESIASRAGTSIGSMYQFFSNKRVVFRALAERNMERSATLFASFFDEERFSRPWREVVDASLDAFAALLVGDPGFRALWVNFQLYGDIAEDDMALTRHFAQAITPLLRMHAPGLDETTSRLVANMCVQIASFNLFVALGASDPERSRSIEETKKAVKAYLGLYATTS